MASIEFEDTEGRIRRVSLGIPDELMKARISNLEDRPEADGYQDAINGVRRYMDGLGANTAKGRGLAIVGPVGAGKSHTAAAVLIESVTSQVLRNGYWIRARRFCNAMSPGFDQEDATTVGNRVLNARLLVLDDLGGEHSTEWTQGIIEDLVSERYDRSLPTIITSNLSPTVIESQYGDRTWDRLRDRNDIVIMAASSWRGGNHVSKLS